MGNATSCPLWCRIRGLGDMVQGCGDSLTSGAFAMTKSSRVDSGSESYAHMDSLFLYDADEELVELEVRGAPVTPDLPACSSAGVTLHCCIGNFPPQSIKITRELIYNAVLTSYHEGICTNSERGKTELKEVRNWISDSEGVPLAGRCTQDAGGTSCGCNHQA